MVKTGEIGKIETSLILLEARTYLLAVGPAPYDLSEFDRYYAMWIKQRGYTDDEFFSCLEIANRYGYEA